MSILLVDGGGESGFGVGGRETDEGFEGTSGERGGLRERSAVVEEARRERTYPLLIRREVVVPERSVDLDDPFRSGLRQLRLDTILGVLDVLLDEADREDLLALVGALARSRRHATVEEGVELLKDGRLGGASFARGVGADAEVLLEGIEGGSTCAGTSVKLAGGGRRRRTLLETRLDVAMHAEDVLGDESIPLLVDVVGNDEEEIETTEEGIGEGDVLVRVLVDVVLAVDGVGGGDDRAARI